MKIEECLKLINEQITNLDKVISNEAIIEDTPTLDMYRDVSVQTKQLIRLLFPDADHRLKDLNDSISAAAERDGPSNMRISFIEQAKATRRYLIFIQNSLILRSSVELKEDKLEKLRDKVEEKEIEAERREKVTETKFYGAAIEIIDRLRDQLKNEGEVKREILEIKSELKDIKEILRGLTNISADVKSST